MRPYAALRRLRPAKAIPFELAEDLEALISEGRASRPLPGLLEIPSVKLPISSGHYPGTTALAAERGEDRLDSNDESD